MFKPNCVKSGQLFQNRKYGPGRYTTGVLDEFKKSFSRSEEKWAKSLIFHRTFQSLYTTVYQHAG
jgi:hypothetical protein